MPAEPWAGAQVPAARARPAWTCCVEAAAVSVRRGSAPRASLAAAAPRKAAFSLPPSALAVMCYLFRIVYVN